jgi:hypothetical protein
MSWFKKRESFKITVLQNERSELNRMFRKALRENGFKDYPFNFLYVNKEDKIVFEFNNIVIEYCERLGGWRFEKLDINGVSFDELEKLINLVKDTFDTKEKESD